jgi:hypothetical protein
MTNNAATVAANIQPSLTDCFLAEAWDALQVVRLVSLNILPAFTLRPRRGEQHLIKSGNVFVYRVQKGMVRWTDGKE